MPSNQQQFIGQQGRLQAIEQVVYSAAGGPYTLNNDSGTAFPETAEFILLQAQGGQATVSFTNDLGDGGHFVVENETLQFYGVLTGFSFEASGDTPATDIVITYFRYTRPSPIPVS